MQDVKLCPRCGNGNVYVKDSRNNYIGLWRKRSCVDCGYSFKTYEVLESELDDLKKLRQLDKVLSDVYGKK